MMSIKINLHGEAYNPPNPATFTMLPKYSSPYTESLGYYYKNY